MSVGGKIIDIYPAAENVTRFWVVDRNGDETWVWARNAEDMPKVGDEIWWQAGKIYFDGDRKHLIKYGSASDANWGQAQ